LFQDDSNKELNQFVGFVSSHKKGTLLTSFHIHSFVVFHTDLQKNKDEDPSLFTLKADMPIPMLVYGDSFQWEKYGHHILPSSLDLASHNKASLH
jgi:hypothetical protein